MAIRAHVVSILDELPGVVDAGSAAGDQRYLRWWDGAVRVLDVGLEEVDALRVDHVGHDARIRAARGRGRLAISSSLGLTLTGDHSFIRDDLRVDAAAFIDDHVLVTVPSASGHRVLLLDPTSGVTLSEETIDADDATAFLTAHPTDPIVLAEFAMGQDGTRLLRIDLDGHRIRTTEILRNEDPVFAGFTPRGDRMLIAPHPSDPETLRIFSWPDVAEVGRLSAGDVDADYGLGLAACWVDDERVAAFATEDSLIIADADLSGAQRVDLPIAFGEEGELEALTPLAPGRVAASVWTPSGRLTLVIDVAGSPTGSPAG